LNSYIKGRTEIEGVENRVLRRIFGLKRGDVAGDWRKFHNERNSTYHSPNIRMIKSRRMKLVGHVGRMGK
jgi:hypothetical protein